MTRRWICAFASLAGTALTCAPGWTQGADVPVISCLLEPSRDLAVSAAVQGILVEVAVERGDPVIRGQLLGRIDTSVEEASLAAARYRAESRAAIESRLAQLAEAERRLAQAVSLTERGVASRNVVAELHSESEIARSLLREAEDARQAAMLEVESAAAALEQRRIRAPADGIVLERALSEGEFASPDLPFLTIVSVDKLHAELLLQATAYGSLRLGTVTVLTSESGDARRSGRVVAIDPLIDAGSRTFGLRVELDNSDGAFVAGTRCIAEFPSEGD